MAKHYRNQHYCQYDYSAWVASNGCTPTSGSNGIAAQSGGKVTANPNVVHSKVPVGQETDPHIPGWSLYDLDHAMADLHIGFEVRTGQGWAGVVAARNKGLYVVLQGDSDQFGNGTCSGRFNGDHCIGVHPDNAGPVSGVGITRWRIDDPICQAARYESPKVLRRYAEKLWPSVRFGVFIHPVPLALPDTSEEPVDTFAIPQQPSIAEANKATKLYADSSLTGTSYAIPAGHTKRYIGKVDGALIIGHDRDASVTGKSALFGRPSDWNVTVSP